MSNGIVSPLPKFSVVWVTKQRNVIKNYMLIFQMPLENSIAVGEEGGLLTAEGWS